MMLRGHRGRTGAIVAREALFPAEEVAHRGATLPNVGAMH